MTSLEELTTGQIARLIRIVTSAIDYMQEKKYTRDEAIQHLAELEGISTAMAGRIFDALREDRLYQRRQQRGHA